MCVALCAMLSGCGLQPALDAGVDQTVSEGETVILSAVNGSTADLTSFIWEQLAGPTVVIDNAGSSQAGFTAPLVEEQTDLVFQVTAFSSLGTFAIPLLGDSLDLATKINIPTSDTLTVTVLPNPAPQADAGADIAATSGDAVTLQGAGTIAAEDVALTHEWTQLSGTVVSLSSADQPSASFVAPEVAELAELVFQLTVEAEAGNTATDTVAVNVEPSASSGPTAIVSGDSTVYEGQLTTFSGVGSSDPNGGMLTYLWEQIDDNFTISISDPASEIISLTTPVVTEDTALMIRLTVTNEEDRSASSTFITTVQPYPAPIANAGPDQVVNEGTAVLLSGSGSSDPAGGSLTFVWTASTSTISLSGGAIEGPAFTAPSVSSVQVFTFTLTVTNEQGDQSSDQVSVTVRNV